MVPLANMSHMSQVMAHYAGKPNISLTGNCCMGSSVFGPRKAVALQAGVISEACSGHAGLTSVLGGSIFREAP